MTLIKLINNFLCSLKTSLWTLGMMLLLLLAGAFIMPGRQEFQALHSIPLFDWIYKQPLSLSWWLLGTIGVLALLALNTLFCSIESLVRKKKASQWLLLISPQVIHLGFLFMLLAHLLSAAGSSQSQKAAGEGFQFSLSDGTTEMRVDAIDITLDYYGYVSDWKVGLKYLSQGEVVRTDQISPNNPSVFRGFNINVKDLRAYPQEAVLLQINREPGAPWALAGSVLFMTGIVTLILLKIRAEKAG